MASDLNKHLDRARRSLEKNKLREAVAEYQAVLEEAPANQEALQALADIYMRLNEPALAAQFYGAQFDRHIEAGDAAKASAIFTRFLRSFPQPPDRLMRYGILLQKQNRSSEAIEQFGTAAELFLEHQRDIDALACYESIALLDPESVERHVVLGDLAERLKHADLAARSFLRAGQLSQAAGGLDQALEYFGRAHRLLPNDRTGALLFADARLRKGDAEGAFTLLDPLSPNEKDTAFLSLFGEALLRTNRLDRAREIFEAYYRQKPENFGKLFELAAAYLNARARIPKPLRCSRKRRSGCTMPPGSRARSAFRTPGRGLIPKSLALAETVAHLYEELIRETKYFDALCRLFDLYLAAGARARTPAKYSIVSSTSIPTTTAARIGSRISKEKPTRSFLQNILARAAKAATVSGHTGSGFSGRWLRRRCAAAPVSEEARAQQALEDLIVQVEIFLQYSLHTKAIERLERIGELFPGGRREKRAPAHSLRARELVAKRRAAQARAAADSGYSRRRCSGRASTCSRRAATAYPTLIYAFFRGGNPPRSIDDRGNQSPDAPPIHAARGAVRHGS